LSEEVAALSLKVDSIFPEAIPQKNFLKKTAGDRKATRYI
jgi:hypothetical protein